MNKKLKLEELDRLSVEEFKHSKKFPLSLLLDNIRSHHNVGSAFRTADAFKLRSLHLAGITPCPPHREIRKTAIGAEESVAWTYEDDPIAFLNSKKASGVQVIVLEQTQRSIKLNEYKHEAEEVILVVGNEVEGVQQEIVELADQCVEIPQFGTKHSLNVSVALGICTWKIVENLV